MSGQHCYCRGTYFNKGRIGSSKENPYRLGSGGRLTEEGPYLIKIGKACCHCLKLECMVEHQGSEE